MNPFLLAAGRLPGAITWTFGNNEDLASHLVIQADKECLLSLAVQRRDTSRLEILGQVIHIGAEAT